jgi:hypothetical protein
MLNHHHSLKMQGNAYDMTGGEQHYEFMSTFLDAYGNELAVLGRLEATKCTFGALIVITDGSVYTSQPMMIAIVLL